MSRRKVGELKLEIPDCCERCGIEFPFLQLDHVVPRHAGGTNDQENLQWLCPNCHVLKTRLEDPRPTISIEARARMSAGSRNSSGMRGRHHTPEHRAAMSALLRGRSKSDETKRKISEGMKRYRKEAA